MPAPLVAPDSLQIRRSAFAQIYSRPIEIQRAEALAFYELITRDIGHFPEMLNQPTGLVFKRRAGQHVSEVQVNRVNIAGQPRGPAPAATRFLFAETGSTRPVSEFSAEVAAAVEAFRSKWHSVGRVTVTEVSFQATVAVNHPEGSMGFIRERLVPSANDKAHLGRDFPIAQVRLTAPLQLIAEGGQSEPRHILDDAEISLRLEPFAEDPRFLWLESIYKWPLVQMSLQDVPIPDDVRSSLPLGRSLEVNQSERETTSYITAGYNYVNNNVTPYLQALGR